MLATCHRVRNSACTQLSPAHSARHCHSSFPPPGVAPSPSRGGGRAASTASTTPTVSASGPTATSATAAAASSSTAALEQGASASRRKHGGADHRSHGLPDISFHNSLGEEGDKRDAERQKDAGESEEQRFRHAIECPDKVPAV